MHAVLTTTTADLSNKATESNSTVSEAKDIDNDCNSSEARASSSLAKLQVEVANLMQAGKQKKAVQMLHTTSIEQIHGLTEGASLAEGASLGQVHAMPQPQVHNLGLQEAAARVQWA